MSDFNLGTATAYGYAKDKGYTGTEEEFAELMASYASVAQSAAASAEAAAASATTATTKASEASSSATTATNAKTAAETAATTATTKAGEASTSATTASTKAGEASTSASTASTKATEASNSATSAAGSATTASTKAGEAATSATNAAASAAAAAQSAATLVIDATLTHAGQAADAKATGDAISGLNEDFINSLITDTATGAIASFPDGANGLPVKSLTVAVEPVQSGSGDPSPSNIRPISGWSQAKVTRCNKNVVKYDQPAYVDASGNIVSNSLNGMAKPVFVANGKKVTMSVASGHVGYAAFTTAGVLITRNGNVGTSYTYTATQDCTVIMWINDGTTVFNSTTFPTLKPQIEFYPSATAYEPYTAQTVTIDLDGTRYGGTLDVTTGVLTVDSGIASNPFTISTYGTSGAGIPYVDIPATGAVMDGSAISSEYKRISTGTTGVSGAFKCYANALTVYDTRFTSKAQAKSLLDEDNAQFVYELATPITVQLTAEEVTTLLGQNNIWADTGNTEVEYYADTKLYIEKLTVPTEDDMIADHAISSGSFFMVGNTLYRATTAIASGATITVGTNATRLSLADALNTLS